MTWNQTLRGICASVRYTRAMAHTVAHARSANPLADCLPAGALVAVASELFRKSSNVCTELLQGLNDGRRHKRPHAVEPQVLGSSVNEEDGVAESQLADGVAKNNVEVDFVQVVLGRRQGFPTVAFADVGKVPDDGTGFAVPDKHRP